MGNLCRPEASGRPGPPNYISAEDWCCRGSQDMVSTFVPMGCDDKAIEPGTGKCDVFFVHPTYVNGTAIEPRNQLLDEKEFDFLTAEMTMMKTASAFNSTCNIFAPKYRAVTMSTYVMCAGSENAELGKELFKIATNDVIAAFNVFITEHCRGDRPFIIAGHSQGSEHCAILIRDVIQKDESLRSRMVCAYLGGMSLGLDSFTDVPPSQSPTDTNCWAAWATTTTAVNYSLSSGGYTFNLPGDQAILEAFLRPLAEGQDIGPGPYHLLNDFTDRPISVNPLNWTTSSSKAAKENNLGSLGAKDTLCVGLIGAATSNDTCERKGGPGLGGVVQIDLSDSKEDLRKLLGIPEAGEDLHECDFSLFWMNIRQNAKDRVAAWTAKKELLNATQEAEKQNKLYPVL